MNIYDYFKDQPVQQNDGRDCWYVLSNKQGKLEVYLIPVSEMETFLEGTEFVHTAGLIPRFDIPQKDKKDHGKLQS